MQPALTISDLRRKRPVPQSAYVSVKDLAKELGVSDPEQLRPLIDHQYLRILELHDYLPDCLVGRPEPAALAWLRGALQPLALRPFLTIGQTADLMHSDEASLRLLCVSYDIQLYIDPVFGEMLTIRQFHKLWNKLRDTRDGARFDRQAMITLLRTAVNQSNAFRPSPLNYSKRLEIELIRIAKLDEPNRTMRAVAFWEAYRDAKNIRACLSRYYELTNGEQPEIEERLGKLMATCLGKVPVDTL
jgi:hypothetical protein